jgi:hypothetical protein
MAMIERALTRVCRRYEFDRHSEDEVQIAAVMVREFQRGNTAEDELVAVFLGMADSAAFCENSDHAEVRNKETTYPRLNKIPSAMPTRL